jgi:hypothetical protein
MECSICCSTFNKVTRKEIKCKSCNEHVCKQCVVQWLKERTNFTCPCCNVVWDTDFCFNNVSKKISDDYKKIHTDLIFKIEQTFISQTQPFIQIEKMYDDAQKELKETYAHKTMCDSIPMFKRHNRPKAMTWKEDERTKEIAKTYKKKDYLNIIDHQMRELRHKITQLSECLMQHHNIDMLNENLQCNIQVEKQNEKISLPCPINECKGYIFSNTGKCGICETIVCKKCHVIIGQESHECKKEDLETIKMIHEQSKPCPKCFTRISKIDGCDQMFCIHCKTAFSWKTGKIETGRIHNPHYYDELRRINNGIIPREPGDNPNNVHCQEIMRIQAVFREDGKYDQQTKDNYNTLVREYLYQNATLMRYTNNDENINFNTNFKNRLRYLKNEISEDQFKSLIYSNFKNTKCRKEVNNLVNEYLNICRTILNSMYNTFQPRLNEKVFIDLYKLYKDLFDEYKKKYINIYKYHLYNESNEFFRIHIY